MPISRSGGLAAALVLSTAMVPALAAVFSEQVQNDTIGLSNELGPGSDCLSILHGSLSPAMDVDHFYLSAAAGDRIWVLTDTGGPAAADSTRDTAITLLGTTGTDVIESDDDDAVGTGGDATTESGDASLIAGPAAPSPGNYYVRVEGDGAGITDPYRIVLAVTSGADVAETEGNDTIGTADAGAGCDAAVTGAITASDVDVFSVALTAGQLLFVAVDGDPDRATATFDPQVSLLDGAGATILTANSSATSATTPAGEGFIYYAPSAGTYYVRIEAANGTGAYRALIAPSTEPGFADVAVTIDDSDETVVGGQTYQYTMVATNHSPAIAATGVRLDYSGPSADTIGGTNWTCNTTANGVACTYDVALTAGGSTPPLTASVIAPDGDGLLVALATVESDLVDDAPANNEADVGTDLTPAPADSGSGGGGGGSWTAWLLAAAALRRTRFRRPA